MPKETKKRRKPEEVAEKYKPNWQVLRTMPSDGSRRPRAQPEDVSPELSELRRKYLGVAGSNAAGDALATTLVRMVPKTRSDGKGMRSLKTVVVHGDKVIGEEG
jgi:hypothetical protein